MRKSTGILIAIVVIGVALLGVAQTGVGGGGQSNVSGGAGSGTISAGTIGDCAKYTAATTIGDAGAACGSAGGSFVSTAPGATATNTITPTTTAVVGLTVLQAPSGGSDQVDICAPSNCTGGNKYVWVDVNGKLNDSAGLNSQQNINLTSANILMVSSTTPTISSGFNATSPSVASHNGTSSFTVNVGTGTAASSGVVGLPTASNGWNCQAYNLTAHAGARLDDTWVTANTANSVTLGNRTVTTGIAASWTASDILVVNCMAY
jgi:hypothetical protein